MIKPTNEETQTQRLAPKVSQGISIESLVKSDRQQQIAKLYRDSKDQKDLSLCFKNIRQLYTLRIPNKIIAQGLNMSHTQISEITRTLKLTTSQIFPGQGCDALIGIATKHKLIDVQDPDKQIGEIIKQLYQFHMKNKMIAIGLGINYPIINRYLKELKETVKKHEPTFICAMLAIKDLEADEII